MSGFGPGERLRERGLVPFQTVGPGEEAGEPFNRWIVVIDHDGSPLAALPPGITSAAGAGASQLEVLIRTAPDMLVADGDTPVAAALRSPAFELLEPESPVVLTEAGRVVGVWAGPDLADAIVLGPSRVVGGSELAGDIRLMLIQRRCRYAEADVVCCHPEFFPEKPSVMPACANPRHLAAHVFGW